MGGKMALTDDLETIRAVSSVIEEHIPSAARDLPTAHHVFNRTSDIHAQRLIEARTFPLLHFDLVPPKSEWEVLHRAASKLLKSIRRLSVDGIQTLEDEAAELLGHAGHGLPLEAVHVVQALKDAAASL